MGALLTKLAPDQLGGVAGDALEGVESFTLRVVKPDPAGLWELWQSVQGSSAHLGFLHRQILNYYTSIRIKKGSHSKKMPILECGKKGSQQIS